MHAASWLSHLASADRPSEDVLQALLQRAQELQQGTSRHRHLLHGKRLGLMSNTPDDEDAQLFKQAALELAAHVSILPAPVVNRGVQFPQLADIGRVLGRLYDAVECQGVAADTVNGMAQANNIPMLAGLAGREHWVAELAQRWRTPAPLQERRRWLIQAVLLASFG
jgi:ornithine carbamoyltransferase